MKEKFEDRKLTGSINVTLKEREMVWRADKADLCEKIKMVVIQYQKQGYKLTLRQLYYQLVSREWIINHDIVYKKISAILDDLRYCGEIDWEAIEDRGRVPHLPYWVKDIPDALDDTISHYRLDRQQNQSNNVEVWTEKDAISGILKRVTNKYHVRLCVNKGYTSSPAIYASYQRFCKVLCRFDEVTVLYLGDHDSSGLDMIRDIRERLLFMFVKGSGLDDLSFYFNQDRNRFYEMNKNKDWVESCLEDYIEDCGGEKEFLQGFIVKNFGEDWIDNDLLIYVFRNFKVVHVGLTMAQINKYNPPPNPAKITDPRAAKYIEKYGEVSWEVDALKPNVLEKILAEAIEKEIDVVVYENICLEENKDKEKISLIINKINKDEL